MRTLIRKKSILFNRFVKLVEENHQQITEQFMNDLLKNRDTTAYRTIDHFLIYDFADNLYKDLSIWIAKEYPKSKIEERYVKIARERFSMSVPFHEVQKAFVLIKRHLWLFVMNRIYDDTTAYMEALELNNRVTLYFDRATFYMLKGYYDMIYSSI
ncbi:MAG: hypothetical protein JXA20_06200 [Spirochaetes bacterium]|nr:hypothetical protein [Spirochaetota bacterium]